MRWLITLLLILSTGVQAKTYLHEMGQVELPKAPQKVVALDWALTETLLTLDVTPYAIADVQGYKDWVEQPLLPKNVQDVGSRREPNLELLAQLQPDLILISQHLAPAYEKLNSIAPTMVFSVYGEQKQPYQAAEKITRRLGDVFSRQAQAESVITATKTHIQANGERLRKAGLLDRPLIALRFIGDKHLRIHGEGSLADNTLTQMGLNNAWQSPTNQWGFASAAMDKLAEYQQANLLYFGPLEEKDRQLIFNTPLWRAMAFTREQRVYGLPPIWTFGGLDSARRLSDQITRQLVSGQKG